MVHIKSSLLKGSSQNNRRFLWIEVEPTPYYLALAKALMERSPWRIQLLFIFENHSQPWHLKLDSTFSQVLSRKRLVAMAKIFTELRSGDVAGVMVPGWSGILPIATLIDAYIKYCRSYLVSGNIIRISDMALCGEL